MGKSDDTRGAGKDRYDYPDLARSEVIPLIPSNARRVLDVGCAWGGFGAALKEARPETEVWGIEADEAAAAAASERLDRVVNGLAPADLPPGERFDAVTFLDVLEHTPDPWDVLRSCRPLVHGVVVASLPNVRHHSVVFPLLLDGRWEYSEFGILDRTHLRFFTKRSIRALFEDCGYAIERLVPVSVRAPSRRSKAGVGLRLLRAEAAEQLTTFQYGVVASPLP